MSLSGCCSEESDDCMEVCESECIAQNTSLTPAEGPGAACTAGDHNNQSSLTAASCQAFCLCFDGGVAPTPMISPTLRYSLYWICWLFRYRLAHVTSPFSLPIRPTRPS